MLAELDALLTALYVAADDFLPERRGPGRPPRITDAELLALAVAQVLLDCPKERRWVRFAKGRLGHLFPTSPASPATTSAYEASRRSCAGSWPTWRSSPTLCDRAAA